MATDKPDIHALFNEAAARTSPEERSQYLDEACGSDPKIRERVEALLRAHSEAGGFFGGQSPASPTTDIGPGTERPGTVIGPYKLLQQLGEGGMGTVFMAEQSEPVQRKVALKVIKPGMDSRQVIARFEAERQALALMEHPNIAKVLDAGATASGRPYFVMELVKGISITDYCDQQQLTPKGRLELFIPVCQAVQHAHQKGIIHRDLKPSNVLIALYDGKPVPKVIDFGVAKATGQKLTERTMYTAVGQIIGTLEYMAPEQAELNNLDIDTRADIYSLGALLYELLAGSPPFTAEQLRGAALAEMLRTIREDDPPKPSARVSSSDALASIAAVRRLEPKHLTRLLRGDLDWIAMKCLEKERGRRYETANGLTRDLQRYLADEVVEARPPSAGYRLRKFARRHKAQVIAASLVLLVLLAGMAGTTYGLLQANQARAEEQQRADGERHAKLAAIAAAEAEKLAKQAAETRQAETQAVLDFVENKIFAAARPKDEKGGLGYDVKLADAIKSALPFVEQSFKDQPLIEARLRMTMGTSFFYLRDDNTALRQYEAARRIYSRHLGPDHPQTLKSMNNLAGSYRDVGRMQDALKLLEKTLQLEKRKLGPDHPDTLKSMNNLALSYADAGRMQDSLKLHEETLQLQKSKLGPDHPDTLMGMNNLAACYRDVGRMQDALKLHEKTLQLQERKLGPDHPDTLMSMNNLAAFYLDVGRMQDALKLQEEALKLRRARLGTDHPKTLSSMNNVANSYAAVGRNREALKLREETLKLIKAKLGPDHPDTLMSMHNLAISYAAVGRMQDALKLQEKTLQLQESELGPDHPDTLASMNTLAACYRDVGRMQEALRLGEETLQLQKSKLGPDHPDTLGSMNNLANSYRDVGRMQDALKLLEKTLQLRKSKLGPNHPDTLKSMGNLALSYADAGRMQDALKLHEETLQLRKSKLGPNHPDTLKSMHNLANSYAAIGRHKEALNLLEETLKLRKAMLGPDHPDTLASMNNLAGSYADLGRDKEALKLFEETLNLRKAKLGLDHPDTLASMNNLAGSYADLGRDKEALKLFEETLKLRKAILGPDHPDTLMCMYNLASCLDKLDRGREALPIIEVCLQRAAGKDVAPQLLFGMHAVRFQHFQTIKDVTGCRATAEMWEKLNHTDADSLYNAACFRAMIYTLINETKDSGAAATKLANDEADRALAWLKQSIAAGFSDAVHMAEDKDLKALRGREDFEKLLAELTAKQKKPDDKNQQPAKKQ